MFPDVNFHYANHFDIGFAAYQYNTVTEYREKYATILGIKSHSPHPSCPDSKPLVIERPVQNCLKIIAEREVATHQERFARIQALLYNNKKAGKPRNLPSFMTAGNQHRTDPVAGSPPNSSSSNNNLAPAASTPKPVAARRPGGREAKTPTLARTKFALPQSRPVPAHFPVRDESTGEPPGLEESRLDLQPVSEDRQRRWERRRKYREILDLQLQFKREQKDQARRDRLRENELAKIRYLELERLAQEEKERATRLIEITRQCNEKITRESKQITTKKEDGETRPFLLEDNDQRQFFAASSPVVIHPDRDRTARTIGSTACTNST